VFNCEEIRNSQILFLSVGLGFFLLRIFGVCSNRSLYLNNLCRTNLRLTLKSGHLKLSFIREMRSGVGSILCYPRWPKSIIVVELVNNSTSIPSVCKTFVFAVLFFVFVLNLPSRKLMCKNCASNVVVLQQFALLLNSADFIPCIRSQFADLQSLVR
jgi:hypothetical protein